MAESVYRENGRPNNARSLTLLGSSDLLIDPWCDLCYDELTQKTEAGGFCTECNSFICRSCIRAHKKVPVLWTHIIVPKSRMPKCQADKPIKYLDCKIHAYANDQFCVDHGIMVCTQCINLDHRCCKTSDITTLCKGIDAADLRQLNTTIDNLKQALMSIKAVLETNTAEIEKQRNEMIKQAETIRDILMNELQNLYSKTVQYINSICNQTKADINSKVSYLTSECQSFDEAISAINKVAANEAFVANHFIRLKQIVDRARLRHAEIEKEMKTMNTFQLSLSIVPELREALSKQTLIGKVEQDASEVHTTTQLSEITFLTFKQSTNRMQEKKNGRAFRNIYTTTRLPIDIKIPKDTSDCDIWGMNVADNGSLLLVDRKNTSLKIFSSNRKLLSSLPLPGVPLDFTIIDDTTAAVCLSDGKLRILDISNPALPSIQNSVPLKYAVLVVTACDKDLVVVCWSKPKKVKMIGLDGNKLWSTLVNDQGQSLFGNPDSVATTTIKNKSSVIVSDNEKNTLTILDGNDGKLIRIINLHRKGPQGLTTDDDGNIYVCYSRIREISVWSPDLTQSSILLSGSDLQKCPQNILYTSVIDELIVSYFSSNTIDCFGLA